MPVVYEIDRDSNIIRTRCIGDVSFANVLQHFQELESDTSLPDHLHVLLDLSESFTLPSTDQLRSVASEVARLKPQRQWGMCAVVASADVVFGMSRMFEAFTQESFVESRVFRSAPEAEGWLASIPPEAK